MRASGTGNRESPNGGAVRELAGGAYRMVENKTGNQRLFVDSLIIFEKKLFEFYLKH